jgi:uncharacterized protein YdeI (YjbR/CyaY-like superfamily)
VAAKGCGPTPPSAIRSSEPLLVFDGAPAFRAWLRKNHAQPEGILVRCYKVHAKDQGITYLEALDEALCFGWIDGVRRQVDGNSFSVRFSIRKEKSVWSAVNVKRASALVAAGRMQPPGTRAFERRQAASAPYSYERRPQDLAPAPAAWAFHSAQPAGYRRLMAFWVMSAKHEETRLRRLAQLIECASRGSRIPLPGKPAATPAAKPRAKR